MSKHQQEPEAPVSVTETRRKAYALASGEINRWSSWMPGTRPGMTRIRILVAPEPWG
jgi:hypothetical protein